MSLQKIKFGDKEVDKKKFYSSKEAILLDSVDLSKIVVSRRWKLNDTKYKYFCGYLNNDVIKPLCVILPQMDGYIKYFDNGGKNMSFVAHLIFSCYFYFFMCFCCFLMYFCCFLLCFSS